jgi:tetratricopeptide (TPR) repeat protein
MPQLPFSRIQLGDVPGSGLHTVHSASAPRRNEETCVNFSEFMEKAWKEHAIQSLQVSMRIESAFRIIEQPDQIPAMAHLVTHVFGEHLGRWDEGIRLLNELRRNPAFEQAGENAPAVARFIASLELAGGKRTSVADLSNSDQIRVLAIAAAALAEQGDAPRAQILFRHGLQVAQQGLRAEDPANRALAVAGNNLACALEEKSVRSELETELMILAAQTARTYWGIAGNWLHWERAEYRLAKAYLQAGDSARSLEHAQKCLEISQLNGATALELFFGCEASALAQKAMGNAAGFAHAAAQARHYFDSLGTDDQGWCTTALESLR